MKLAQIIYKFASWLDRKHIEKYDYETAPYCGHHYSGHNGKFTSSKYHEGDGFEMATLPLFKGWKIIAHHEDEEGWSWCISKKYRRLSSYNVMVSWEKIITYHGNVLFRKGFTNKLFSYHHGGAKHFLGFRFTTTIR